MYDLASIRRTAVCRELRDLTLSHPEIGPVTAVNFTAWVQKEAAASAANDTEDGRGCAEFIRRVWASVFLLVSEWAHWHVQHDKLVDFVALLRWKTATRPDGCALVCAAPGGGQVWKDLPLLGAMFRELWIDVTDPSVTETRQWEFHSQCALLAKLMSRAVVDDND